MARDFLGMNSKDSIIVVDDDSKEPSFMKGSSVQWPFLNKVSAPPQFTPFRTLQEEKTKKSIFDPISSSGFTTTSTTTDAFDANQKAYASVVQKNFNLDRQGGTHYSMAAYPVQPVDLYSTHRSNEARAFSSANQTVSPAMNNPFFGTSNMKQQPLGGIPVLTQSGNPSASSMAGTTDQRNMSKTAGGPSQLTIFYGGSVCVYDDVSPEKAQAIMFLAGNGSSTNTHATPTTNPHTSVMNHHTSPTNSHTSTVNNHTSPTNPRNSTMNHHTSPTNPSTSTMNHHASTTNTPTSTMNHQTSTTNPRTSTMNHHTSTTNPHTSPMNPHASTANPHTSIMSPRMSTTNPRTSVTSPLMSTTNHHTSATNTHTSTYPHIGTSKSQTQVPTPRPTGGDGVRVNQSHSISPCSGLSSPISATSHVGVQSRSGSSGTDDLMSAKSKGPMVAHQTEPQKSLGSLGSAGTMVPAAVPQARKASLARFLEKRKERVMNTAAPYSISDKKSSESNPKPGSHVFNFSSNSTASLIPANKEQSWRLAPVKTEINNGNLQ